MEPNVSPICPAAAFTTIEVGTVPVRFPPAGALPGADSDVTGQFPPGQPTGGAAIVAGGLETGRTAVLRTSVWVVRYGAVAVGQLTTPDLHDVTV